MSELVVEVLHKHLGSNHVLKGVSLELAPGEIITLLGASGSGKTTILRSVAGLEVPDKGRIVVSGKTVFDGSNRVNVPPEKRGLGLVFQSYALWPNRTVFGNVEYGLKLRGKTASDMEKSVTDILRRLGLADLRDRYPHQLSGGQQQRVALARALAYRPPILLLDEPLSNLDAKLRNEARAWLKELIIEQQISALFVTHDQIEGMAIADRLLMLHEGMIEQEGKPQDLYEKPASLLVASTLGENNQIAGRIGAADDGMARLDFAEGSLMGRVAAGMKVGDAAIGVCRIERTRIGNTEAGQSLDMRLDTSLFLGQRWEHILSLDALRLRVWGSEVLQPGPCRISLQPADLWIFPAPRSG